MLKDGEKCKKRLKAEVMWGEMDIEALREKKGGTNKNTNTTHSAEISRCRSQIRGVCCAYLND